MAEGMVSLSDLPEELVRRILFSYWTPTNPFTKKEAARLSLVSKQFFNLMQNPPILTFTIGFDFEGGVRDMCSTLTRYQEQNIHLDSLKIEVLYGNLLGFYADDVVDECINIAARKRLTNLDLCLRNLGCDLPEAVFKVKSLVRLHLGFCLLKTKIIPVWPNLRELSLHRLYMINEEVFENVMKGCPLIENLIINWCSNISSSFKVSNLPNLKKLDASLRSDETIEVCESAATNLNSIACKPVSKSYPTISLGKHGYLNLKRLDLRKARLLDGNLFSNFGSRFPRLEYLSIGPATATLRINLTSSSLKEICLRVNRNVLEEACFDVPNIVSFKYRHKCQGRVTLPRLLFKENSGFMSDIEPEKCLDNTQKLIFAALNMPFEASIRVKFPEDVTFLNEDRWIEVLPPAGFISGIRQFTITQLDFWRLAFSLPFARGILDAIFKIYRPQTITFTYDDDKYDIGECVYVEHNIKCVWDAATNSPTPAGCDEILELLKAHKKNTIFTAVFNLEYYDRRSEEFEDQRS